MANTNEKKTSSKTTTKKPKATTTKKASASKEVTAPKKKRTTKANVVVNKAPSSLVKNQKEAGTKLNNTISKKRDRKSKKKKKGGSVLEKRFWQIIIALFLIVGVALTFYILSDYFDDTTTPRAIETEQLSVENEEMIRDLAASSEIVEESSVSAIGPVIYIHFYLGEDQEKALVYKEVEAMFAKIAEESPEILETYDFNFFVTMKTLPETEEGVLPKYPYMGSRNAVTGSIVWTSHGQFEEPVQEEEDEVEEETNE